MFTELRIQNFRGIHDLVVSPLGRINLCVGRNAAGKTSLLEAVELTIAKGDPSRIRTICTRRGELLGDTPEQSILDPRHLFLNRVLNQRIHIELNAASSDSSLDLSFCSDTDGDKLLLDWHPDEIQRAIDLTASKETITLSTFSGRMPWDSVVAPRCLFVPSSGLSQLQIMRQLDSILLTDEEDTVIECLKLIDPTIERIAVAMEVLSAEGRFGGVVVNCHNRPPRLPIGSFGEGIWRLLGIALGLTWCRDGILLIDDIDSGLHYSVLKQMWRMIFETSRKLNVQLFATTHSRDCVDSLAAIAREDVYEGSEVVIHRIEAGKPRSISYSEAGITAVAEFGNEVR